MFKIHIGAPIIAALPGNTAWGSIPILDQRTLSLSLGVGALAALCTALIWHTCIPSSLPLGAPSWESIVLVMIALVFGHEAFHLAGFPKFGLAPDTVVGIWPEFGSPYVQHLAPMKRNRFLLSVSLPFVAITIVPILLSLHFSAHVDHLSWISVLNSIGAGSDIVVFAKLVISVPTKSFVVESGKTLHWSSNPEQCHIEQSNIACTNPKQCD